MQWALGLIRTERVLYSLVGIIMLHENTALERVLNGGELPSQRDPATTVTSVWCRDYIDARFMLCLSSVDEKCPGHVMEASLSPTRVARGNGRNPERRRCREWPMTLTPLDRGLDRSSLIIGRAHYYIGLHFHFQEKSKLQLEKLN